MELHWRADACGEACGDDASPRQLALGPQFFSLIRFSATAVKPCQMCLMHPPTITAEVLWSQHYQEPRMIMSKSDRQHIAEFSYLSLAPVRGSSTMIAAAFRTMALWRRLADAGAHLLNMPE